MAPGLVTSDIESTVGTVLAQAGTLLSQPTTGDTKAQAQTMIDDIGRVLASFASDIDAFDAQVSDPTAGLRYQLNDYRSRLQDYRDGQIAEAAITQQPPSPGVIDRLGNGFSKMAKTIADLFGAAADTTKTILYILAVAIGLALIAAVFIYMGGR